MMILMMLVNILMLLDVGIFSVVQAVHASPNAAPLLT
jgi:hypothetical protein